MKSVSKSRTGAYWHQIRTGLVVLVWLTASGSLLDMVQVYAWGQMFLINLETQSAEEALATTFTEEGKCPMCKGLEKVRAGTENSSPLTPAVTGKAPLLPVVAARSRVEEPKFRACRQIIENCRKLECMPVRPPVPPPRLS